MNRKVRPRGTKSTTDDSFCGKKGVVCVKSFTLHRGSIYVDGVRRGKQLYREINVFDISFEFVFLLFSKAFVRVFIISEIALI